MKIKIAKFANHYNFTAKVGEELTSIVTVHMNSEIPTSSTENKNPASVDFFVKTNQAGVMKRIRVYKEFRAFALLKVFELLRDYDGDEIDASDLEKLNEFVKFTFEANL